MDSYHHHHHHMMDTDYGNIVYSGALANQLPPTDEMLLQNSQSVGKDIQYNATRESIIASNISVNAHHMQHIVYHQQQQQQQPEQQQQPPPPAQPMDMEQMENGQPPETFTQYMPAPVDNVPVVHEHQAIVEQPDHHIETFKTEPFKTETDLGESNDAMVTDDHEMPTTSSEIQSDVPEIVPPVDGEPMIPTNEQVDSVVDETATLPTDESAVASTSVDTAEVVDESATVATAVDAAAVTPSTKDNEIDPNQCRVCLAKDDLTNIFSYEDRTRICDLITAICTQVKILTKDYLPQYICAGCLAKVRIATEFKNACETTDKELRKKLKRGKNKIRGGSSRYLLVDCELSSDSADDKKNEDDEFHLSEVADSDSDVSFKIGGSGKRKKTTKPKKKSQRSKKSEVKESKRDDYGRSSSKKKKSLSSRSTRTSNRIQAPPVTIPIDVVYVEAARIINRDIDNAPADDDDDDDSDDAVPLSSRRTRRSNADTTPKPKSLKKKAAPASTVAIKSKPGPKSSKKDADALADASSASSSKVPHKKRKHISTAEMSSDDNTSKKGTPSTQRKERPCDLCDQIFTSWQSLKDHKKTHVGEKPLVCHICNRPFKQRVSLDAHVRKHMEDETRMCKPCDKQFASRLELRKHQQTVHEADFTFECDKCKRTFTSEARLNTHKDGKCPGFDTTQRKKPEVEVSANLGRDLFKCVAPITSTYWSDDFSE